jgi:hypothetical protein
MNRNKAVGVQCPERGVGHFSTVTLIYDWLDSLTKKSNANLMEVAETHNNLLSEFRVS